MKTILEIYQHQVVVNKSTFIAIFFPIKMIKDFNLNLRQIKDKFPGAKHYCYAYRFHSKNKFSDDGEPSGSAGRPILKSLEEHELDNCGIVIVRYFGGKLLGSANLLRTYLRCASETIASSHLICVMDGFYYEIDGISYPEYSILKENENNYNYYFKNVIYRDTISFGLLSQRDITNNLYDLLKRKISIKSITKIQFIEGGTIYVSE
jgi:putative IMPACT (imprinted ancient) family translation regulator